GRTDWREFAVFAGSFLSAGAGAPRECEHPDHCRCCENLPLHATTSLCVHRFAGVTNPSVFAWRTNVLHAHNSCELKLSMHSHNGKTAGGSVRGRILREDGLDDCERGIRGGNPAVDRRLQHDLDDLVPSEAV